MSDGAVWAWQFAFLLVLAAPHFLAGHIRRLPFVPEDETVSFGAGAAVAFVFLHTLPELALAADGVGEVLIDAEALVPLRDIAVFIFALAGFLVFYGMEKAVRIHRDRGHGQPVGVYRLHLVSFGVFNVLLMFSLAEQAGEGPTPFTGLFLATMVLHYLLIDRGFEEHFAQRFNHLGRFILLGALIVGLLLARIAGHEHHVYVEMAGGFVAGSVLLNVFRGEVTFSRRASFGWFTIGALTVTALVIIVTLLRPTA